MLRPNEYDAFLFNASAKFRVFGQKSISWMYCLSTRRLTGSNDFIGNEIRLSRGSWPQ